jgi:hypothetical protein
MGLLLWNQKHTTCMVCPCLENVGFGLHGFVSLSCLSVLCSRGVGTFMTHELGGLDLHAKAHGLLAGWNLLDAGWVCRLMQLCCDS